jgi:hypothetical protein
MGPGYRSATLCHGRAKQQQDRRANYGDIVILKGFVAMIRLLAVAALVVVATPALATERAHTPQQVADALKAGCSVQYVHTPAGKNGHQPAIVHCKRGTTLETARNDSTRNIRPTAGLN